MLQLRPAAPGPGLRGGCLGQHIRSGASCYPGLAQSSDGLSPSSRDPFSGTNIPAAMLTRGICGLQIRWDAGGIGSQRASWTWLSSGSCSPRAERSTASPGRHEGGRVGFTPVALFCSPDPSLSWGGRDRHPSSPAPLSLLPSNPVGSQVGGMRLLLLPGGCGSRGEAGSRRQCVIPYYFMGIFSEMANFAVWIPCIV